MPKINFNFTGYVKPSAQPKNKSGALAAVPAPAQFLVDNPYRNSANIMNQNLEPSCVAHSVVELVTFLWWKKTGNFVKLSPRFVYALCKLTDNLSADSGTTFEAAMGVLKEYGVCEDSYFTNDTTLDVNTYTDATLISAEAKANALQYRIEDWDWIDDISVSGLQSAMASLNTMIAIGTDISDYWWLPSWTDILPLKPMDANNPTTGGHAVTLYAYGQPWDATYPTNFYGINHWSSLWGYNGRFCYGADYEPTVYEACYCWLPATEPTPTPSLIQVSTTPQESVIEEIVEFAEKIL